MTLSGATGDLSELGNAMAAGAAGVLAAAVVYTAATIIGVGRVVEEGRRAATVAALFVAPPLLAATTGLTGRRALGPLGVGVALGLVLATVIVVLALSGALDVVRAVRLGGGGAGVAAVCFALSVVLRPSAPAGELGDIYRRSAIPVALVDGITLDAPAPGWRLHSVDHPLDRGATPGPLAMTSARASIIWQVRDHYVRLELLAQPGTTRTACPYAELGWVCERLGVTPGGSAIWGTRRPGDPTGPGYGSLWVDVDGGRWQLAADGPPRSVDVGEAVQVLSRLQPVDVDDYLAVAGRGQGRPAALSSMARSIAQADQEPTSTRHRPL